LNLHTQGWPSYKARLSCLFKIPALIKRQYIFQLSKGHLDYLKQVGDLAKAEKSHAGRFQIMLETIDGD
jgi:hypothetical protein